MTQLLVNLSFIPRHPTGHGNYARNLLPALGNLDPILLTPQAIPDFSCHTIAQDMNPEFRTRGHLKRLIWTQFRLPNLYRKLKGHLLFSPIPEAPLWTTCRTVVTLHDLIPLRFNTHSRLTAYFRHYIPRVLQQAQHVLCDSTATASDAIDYYQIPTSKLTVVPLAYDTQNFRFLSLETKNYFLYIGRHDSYKNLQRALLAFRQLPGDYEFWIAGPSDEDNTLFLQNQVAELNLQRRVKFLGYVSYSELPKLMNQAIGLVFVSLWEGFGLPVLEAMACGTPVITSNLSSLPEVAGEAALLVDPYDVDEITAAMKSLATQSQLCAQLRAAGLNRARDFAREKTSHVAAGVLQQYL